MIVSGRTSSLFSVFNFFKKKTDGQRTKQEGRKGEKDPTTGFASYRRRGRWGYKISTVSGTHKSVQDLHLFFVTVNFNMKFECMGYDCIYLSYSRVNKPHGKKKQSWCFASFCVQRFTFFFFPSFLLQCQCHQESCKSSFGKRGEQNKNSHAHLSKNKQKKRWWDSKSFGLTVFVVVIFMSKQNETKPSVDLVVSTKDTLFCFRNILRWSDDSNEQ